MAKDSGSTGEPSRPPTATERHARSAIMGLPRNLLAVTSGVPLYYRLSSTIQEMVDDGRIVPGEQLPPEEQIAAHLSIARNTARQAIDCLIRAGTLQRRRGIGTFVRSQAHDGRSAPSGRQVVPLKARPSLTEPHLKSRTPRRREPPGADHPEERSESHQD